ncbi:MAG: hypothetical protein HFJ09_04375 [Lachnospiraceae bacterium]|nr:hypothetical protein [Lachnospiraceae bacterium]
MNVKMRMKIKILLCICFIVLLSSCTRTISESENRDKDMKYTDIEQKAQKCNLNTVNYLFCDKEKDLDLYFSINISKLNIQRADLYMDEILQIDDISINEIYDNVINITITEDISNFNSIRVYDSNGEHLDFYVGEYYFEPYKQKTFSKDIDTESKIRIEDTDREVKVIVCEKKEVLVNHEVRIKNPKEVEKYFDCDIEKETESRTFIYTLKSQYAGKVQISYEFAIEFVNLQTKEVDTKMIYYLPMLKEES